MDRPVTVKLSNEFLHGCGFGGFLVGTTLGEMAQIYIDLPTILRTAKDCGFSSKEVFDGYILETVAHEVMHAVEEVLGREFSEDLIEDILSRMTKDS